MVHTYHLLFLLLLLPGVVAGSNGTIFDALDMEVFNGTVDSGGDNFDGCNRTWTKFDDYTGARHPYCPVVFPRHISASINITGYRGMIQIEGVDCVSGCPADLAIIDQRVSTSYAGFEANKDWVRQVTTVKSSDGNTTASVRVSFLWHWTTRSSVTGANKKHYRVEHKTVSVTKPHPTTIPNATIDCIAYITFYNNSRSPVAFIDIDVPETVIKTIYTYNNSTITKYNTIGIVQDQSIVFENDTIVWQADPNQTTMTRRGDSAVINGEAFNVSDLTITLCTPYTQHIIDEFVVDVIEQDGKRPMIILRMLMVVGAMIIGLVMMVGAVRRSL